MASLDKVWTVMVLIKPNRNDVCEQKEIVSIFSTKEAADAQAADLNKTSMPRNSMKFKHYVEEHDVYLHHISNEEF